MPFMVIERPKDGDFTAVGDRFRRSDRMLPVTEGLLGGLAGRSSASDAVAIIAQPVM
jgi:hypothetical protein